MVSLQAELKKGSDQEIRGLFSIPRRPYIALLRQFRVPSEGDAPEQANEGGYLVLRCCLARQKVRSPTGQRIRVSNSIDMPETEHMHSATRKVLQRGSRGKMCRWHGMAAEPREMLWDC